MPNIDAGHYFLTTLFPIKDGDVITQEGQHYSPVFMIRQLLASLPTNENSPFARNLKNHFIRIFVIDDVPYNGRRLQDTLLGLAKGDNLLKFQSVDELKSPYLVFLADVDAPTKGEQALDDYLKKLWAESEKELRALFAHCYGFEKVNSDEEFRLFMRKGQVETTMSFHDYFTSSPPPLKSLSLKSILWPGVAAIIALDVAAYSLWKFSWLGIALLSLGGILALLYLIYITISLKGRKPFPTPPNSDLPSVLKSIYLHRQFTKFIIDNQTSSAKELHESFAQFVKDTNPDDLTNPTQPPGKV